MQFPPTRDESTTDARRWTAPPMTASAWLRYDVLAPRIAAFAPTSVLEVGAGVGALGARLARSIDRYVGVEPDPESRERASSRLAEVPGADASVVADIQDVAEDPFDLVCAFEVLEHIEDDRAALTEWVRRLRPGGMLLLSVPAFPERFGPTDELVGHYRRYAPGQIDELVHLAGLVDVDVQLYGFPAGVALEHLRNLMARRSLAAAQRSPEDDERPTGPQEGSSDEQPSGAAQRSAGTARSGRWLQPGAVTGRLLELGMMPARWLQRGFPDRGTGLIVEGRRPSTGE